MTPPIDTLGADVVHVLDQVTLPVADADEWLQRWQQEYFPAAQERGLTLVQRWRSYSGTDAITIGIL